MDKEEPSPNILETTASYYVQATKKWIRGTLYLKQDTLEFYENDKICIILLLDEICTIRCRNSSLIFGSIVITAKAVTHWFSSLPNKDSVLNILNLFWHYHSVSRSGQHNKSKDVAIKNTQLGRELLQLARESEKTLVATSATLYHQGQQLENATDIMEDINSDLTVAEKLIGFISSWVYGVNSSSTNAKRERFEMVDRKADQYSVVYCLTKSNNRSDCYSVWLPGLLELDSKGLRLYNNKFHTVANFNKQDVQSVEVISSWEFRILNVNQDMTYEIKCPSLSNLRNVLNIIFGKKLSFANNIIPWNVQTGQTSFSSVLKAPWCPDSEDDGQIQAFLTSDEIEELNATVSQLKSLAIEVGLEQSNQMEKIDSLLETVHKTDARIKEDTKNIKKLI